MLSLRRIQCEACRAKSKLPLHPPTHDITQIEGYLLSTEDEYLVYHDHSFVYVAIMVAFFFSFDSDFARIKSSQEEAKFFVDVLA